MEYLVPSTSWTSSQLIISPKLVASLHPWTQVLKLPAEEEKRLTSSWIRLCVDGSAKFVDIGVQLFDPFEERDSAIGAEGNILSALPICKYALK